MFLDCFRILLLQFYVVALLIQSKSLVDARDVTSSDTCTEWKTGRLKKLKQVLQYEQIFVAYSL